MQYSVFNFVWAAIALSSVLTASARPVVSSTKQTASTASASSSASKTVGAAYVITNDPSGNRIVAMNIGSDGLLSSVSSVRAGGDGVHGLSSPLGPDPLFSQGVIKVNAANNMLVTVNSASNTAVMFNIDPNNPSSLTMVGKPVNSGGEFPISLAINKEGSMVCVLNGGAVNGVNCYTVDKNLGLVAKANTLRSLGLNQTTPATGPAGTASHVIFNADESQLIASVKGVPPTPGFLAAWNISPDGSLSSEPVKSTPANGGLLPFGMALVPNSNAVVVADAGVGVDVFDFGAKGAKGKGGHGAKGKGDGKGKNKRKGKGKGDDKKATGDDKKAKDNAKAQSPNDDVNSSANSTAVASSDSSSNSTSNADVNASSNSSANANANSTDASAASQSNGNHTMHHHKHHHHHHKSGNNSTVLPPSSSNSSSSEASSTITPVSGQGAVCWTSFSPKSGNFYVTDIATALITEVNVSADTNGDGALSASVVNQYQQPQGSAPIDLEVASVGSNDFLYVLAANATSINVLSVNQPANAKAVQTFDFGTALAKQVGGNANLGFNLQGMATFVKQ